MADREDIERKFYVDPAELEEKETDILKVFLDDECSRFEIRYSEDNTEVVAYEARFKSALCNNQRLVGRPSSSRLDSPSSIVSLELIRGDDTEGYMFKTSTPKRMFGEFALARHKEQDASKLETLTTVYATRINSRWERKGPQMGG